MKKNKLITFAVTIALLLLALAACGGTKEFTVVYMDGQTEHSRAVVKAGERVPLPDLQKDGYTFEGWFFEDGAKLAADTTLGKGVHTVYARFTQGVTVRFLAGDPYAKGSMPSQTVTAQTLLAPNAFSRAGYDFVGWSLSAGGQKVLDDNAPAGDLSPAAGAEAYLFALWQRNQKTIVHYTQGTSKVEEGELGAGDLFIPLDRYAPAGGAEAWRDDGGALYDKQTIVSGKDELSVTLAFTLSAEGALSAQQSQPTNLVIPPAIGGIAVTSISPRAFEGRAVETAAFPDSLQEIGERAFLGCRSLAAATFGNGSDFRRIGDLAFALTALQTVVIPASVEQVGEGAFYLCDNLTRAEFRGVCDFEPSAFYGDDGEDVYFLGTYIFVPDAYPAGGAGKPYEDYRAAPYYMDVASHIFPASKINQTGVITEGDAVIGYIGAEGAEPPTTLVILSGRHIARHAFSNYQFLRRVSLPATLETIGRHAFYNCFSLENIGFPNSLKRIEDYAFAAGTLAVEANRMTWVEFPEGFLHLGDGAFLTCALLQYIRIPSTTEYLGFLAFATGSNLLRVEIMTAEVPEIGWREVTGSNSEKIIATGIFEYVNGAQTKIFVPDGAGANGQSIVKNYREHPAFKNFAKHFRPLTQGAEAGAYAGGVLSVTLDGGDCFDFVLFEGNEPTARAGTYTLAGNAVTFTFDDDGTTMTGTLSNGLLTIDYDGTAHPLGAPQYYYDYFNWADFILNPADGTGMFSMGGGYYPTPFEYEIEGDVFKLYIDGNNSAPTPPEYIGVALYIGTIADDKITISFYLNDWLMDFTFDLVQEQEPEIIPPFAFDLAGTYIWFMENWQGEFNPFYTVTLADGGTGTLLMGSSSYSLTYIVSEDTITLNVNVGVPMQFTLKILPDGNLFGQLFSDGIGERIFERQES